MVTPEINFINIKYFDTLTLRINMLQNLAVTYLRLFDDSATWHITRGWVIFITIFAILLVIEIVAIWKIFVKAGRPGWAAVIPVYNYWVLFEISGKPGWWALFAVPGFLHVLTISFLSSIILIVLYIIAALELAKRFKKDTTFAVVGLIIFSYIGLLILGFGDDKYHAPKAIKSSN